MSASELQAFLRFLSQDAKVPLAMAMSKMKDLQSADLGSAEKLSKAKAGDIALMFPDEKMAKTIVSAAKRVTKKRAMGDDAVPSPKKRRKEDPFATKAEPADLETSVALPTSSVEEDELANTVVFTNRAPLVLAFAVTLLKYTMPEQPLSSRLSLAQAYVSTTSRSRAVNLGIQDISKDEEEQERKLGEGQPTVTIMGKELKVLRRWGYEWKGRSKEAKASPEDVGDPSEHNYDGRGPETNVTDENLTHDDELPALWALDLEALRKSNSAGQVLADRQKATHSNLPIYTPQSARAYLLKSFDSPPPEDSSAAKKPSAAGKAAEKERNLGKLLHALDLLYDSWAGTFEPDELDKRTWSWYVKVRPAVEQGVAGWGGKNEVKLADILALRR